MANANVRFGLRPVGKLGSNPHNGGMTEYRIAAANTNALYQGQPCIPLASGYIDTVGGAEGGTVGLLGAFWGCQYVSSTTGQTINSPYWPGSGANSSYPVRAWVYDDPCQLFVIASSATLTNEATFQATVFANADFATATTGSTATGMSYGQLDTTTVATTNTLNLRILGYQDDPVNQDWTAAGIPIIVRLNNHFNSPNGAIAGGTVSNTGV